MKINKYIDTRIIILLTFIVLCFISRTIYLDQKNLWNDEAYSWQLSMETASDLTFITANDIHPPLYYLILKSWTSLFGDSLKTMRLLSVLFSCFSLIFLYLISTKILNKIGTFIVLTLYLTSPVSIYFAQETRMYALNLLLNLGSVYYFIRILQTKESDRSGETINRVFYIIFSIAAIYTHYVSFFIILSQYLFFIISISCFGNRIKKTVSVNLAIIFISYIPWIPIFIIQLLKGQAWRKSLNLSGIFEKLVYFFKDLLIGSYYYITEQETFFIIFDIIIIITIIIFCYFYFISLKNILKRSYLSNEFLLYTLVLIPILIAFVISFKKNLVDSRYLSIILPFILISVISLLQKIKKRSISAFIILIIISLNIYGNILYFKSDYRSVNYSKIFNKINSKIKDDDKIIVQPGYYSYIIDYYAKQTGAGFKKTEKYHNLLKFIPAEKSSIFDNIYNFYDQTYRNNQIWNFKNLVDSILYYNVKDFWLLIDYCSDSTNYFQNLEKIENYYDQKYFEKFNISPYEQKLFFFQRKQ